MTETTITLKKLVASPEHILTNGDVYGKEVFLGVNDSADNWHEISMEEYNKIMDAREEEEKRLADMM